MGLETVEVVLKLEEKFGVTLPDEDLADLAIVGDIAVYVAKKANMETDNIVEVDEVIEFLLFMFEKEFNIPRNKVTLKSHVIKDLGLN